MVGADLTAIAKIREVIEGMPDGQVHPEDVLAYVLRADYGRELVTRRDA